MTPFTSPEAQALAGVLGMTEGQVQAWAEGLSKSDVDKLKLLALYILAHPG